VKKFRWEQPIENSTQRNEKTKTKRKYGGGKTLEKKKGCLKKNIKMRETGRKLGTMSSIRGPSTIKGRRSSAEKWGQNVENKDRRYNSTGESRISKWGGE